MDRIIIGLLVLVAVIVLFKYSPSYFPNSAPSSAPSSHVARVVQMLKENKKTSEIMTAMNILVPADQISSVFAQAQAQYASELRTAGPKSA